MQRRNGNRPSVRVLLFLCVGLLLADALHTPSCVGWTSTTTGPIDQGETATCIGDAGTLCPLDAVACQPAESAPTCPTGGSYVSADDQCEAASWTCSLDGSLYDSQAFMRLRVHPDGRLHGGSMPLWFVICVRYQQ